MLHPVIFLASRVQKPTMQDYDKFINELKYLNRTKELGLVFDEMNDNDNTARLSVFCDATYAVHDDIASTSTHVLLLSSKLFIASKMPTPNKSEVLGA